MDDTAKKSPADTERRLLLRATITAGSIAGVVSAVPFLGSMAPSQRALSEGAPVDVDIAAIAPSNMVSVAWRGKPVWILHRTEAMIASLQQHDDMLLDPLSERSEQPAEAQNGLRSVKPEFAVLIGICTHLGCVPVFRPEPQRQILALHGQAGFTALAMVQSSIWLAAYSRMYRRR